MVGPGASGAAAAGTLDLAAAIAALRAGAVVAIPTDTVYGLAVDPSCPGSTDALFALKSRPPSLDLPVLVGSIEQAEMLAGPEGLPASARRLADAFWPGALTIVVPRRRGLDWVLGVHTDTIGLRIPDHTSARALCSEVGALATTSANVHGEAPVRRRRRRRDACSARGWRCSTAGTVLAPHRRWSRFSATPPRASGRAPWRGPTWWLSPATTDRSPLGTIAGSQWRG